jgi:Tfp pilus assembly protein PilN
MRPINLIPKDQRQGARKPGGPLGYVLIGALVLLLGGVALLVSTNNQISTGKAEITEIQSETASAQARAAELTAYTRLEETHNQRIQTVTSLADSRFDWERVMRELALILPDNIWLTNLSGSANPAVQVDSGTASGLRGGVPGPALEMIGCASSHDAVAGFVSALRDIDGVTRVGMEFSKLPAGGGGTESGSSEAAGGGGGTCQTRPWIPEFQIVVAFDAAPVATTETTTVE